MSLTAASGFIQVADDVVVMRCGLSLHVEERHWSRIFSLRFPLSLDVSPEQLTWIPHVFTTVPGPGR